MHMHFCFQFDELLASNFDVSFFNIKSYETGDFALHGGKGAMANPQKRIHDD